MLPLIMKLDHCFTGSLLNLAKHPSSTVQILGAEKALFRLVMSAGEQQGILCGIEGCVKQDVVFKVLGLKRVYDL